jgi:hypothetical protein
MAASVEPRPLTANETAVLLTIVRAVGGSTGDALAAQIRAATVAGGIPTLLDLAGPTGTERASIDDGVLPVRAFVSEPQGEILVWMSDGYVDGLEFVWTSDSAPTEMPPAEALTIRP